MKKVIKVGSHWEFDEIQKENQGLFVEFDETAFIPISDSMKVAVCILRKEDKYGIYLFDHAMGMGLPATYCSVTEEAFPYEEVKACVFMNDFYGLFAFRMNDKWGIIKVIEGLAMEHSQEVFDVEYNATKMRFLVPCEYPSLAAAEAQLQEKCDCWKNPF